LPNLSSREIFPAMPTSNSSMASANMKRGRVVYEGGRQGPPLGGRLRNNPTLSATENLPVRSTKLGCPKDMTETSANCAAGTSAALCHGTCRAEREEYDDGVGRLGVTDFATTSALIEPRVRRIHLR
jgi:hypothetical protein